VIGLGVVRVLGGVGTILDREDVTSYWVHTVWVCYFVFWLPYFWWFTFDWQHETTWTFLKFFFVVVFSMVAYLTTYVLVPTRVSDTSNLKDYYYRSRRRFFTLLTLLGVADVIDTVLKPGNLDDVGVTYPFVMAFLIIGSAVGIITSRARYHEIFTLAYVATVVCFGLGIYADVLPSG